MQDTGFTEQQYLLRGPDGQFCRLSPLLYRVVEAADGTRDVEAMARHVSETVGKQVSGDNVKWLLKERVGWLVDTGEPSSGTAAPAAAAPQKVRDPLLGLRFRKPLVGERVMNWLSTPLQFLFSAPAVMLTMLVGLVVNWWVWQDDRFMKSIQATVSHPFGPLAVVGLFFLGTVFHEIGHATALKAGGGRVGVMGVGLYLAWPAFYTDVTDSYRLPRWSRVRVDLGGIYFNLLFGLIMCGLERLTGFTPLLFVAVLMQIEAIHQLLPLVRLDGYWILADMLGVPDLFSHVKTHLEGMRKTRRGESVGTGMLRQGPARAFTIYLATVMPAMMVFLGGLVVAAPGLIGKALAAEETWVSRMGQAAVGGNEVSLLTAAAQALLLLLGPLAIVLSLGLFLKRAVKGLRSWGSKSPRNGMLAWTAGLALIAALFVAWVPDATRSRLPGDIARVGKAITTQVDQLRDRDNPTIQRDPSVGQVPGPADAAPVTGVPSGEGQASQGR
jgi:putative peptide zinc metalloprotease protein